MDLAEAIERDAKARQDRLGIRPATKRCIAVLTPTLGQVSMWWSVAMMDLIWPMNCGKAFIPVMDNKGGEVGEMRNRLVAMALAFEKSQGIELHSLFWVDDDVIIPALAMLTLAAHDRDIASGVYMTKGDAGNEALIFDGPSCGSRKFEPDRVFECWGYAQGLSLVRTQVYKHMAEDLDLGKDKYGNPAWYKQPDFGMEANGQLSLGGTEDFHFFGNAAKLGYRPLVDCTKHCFGWHYDAGSKRAYPKQQWEQYVRREPVIWQTKDGEVIWD